MNNTRPKHSIFAFLRQTDLLIAFFLSLSFSLLVFYLSAFIPEVLMMQSNRGDVWFQGDLPRNYAIMTTNDSDFYVRVKTHPLFALITYPAVKIILKVFNLQPLEAVRVIMALVAFSWVFLLFQLLRMMKCNRLETVLFCLLGTVSSASLFWFIVPETFPFGSVSFLIILMISFRAQFLPVSFSTYLLANIMSFSFTITNWMAGILLAVLNNTFQRAMQIILYTFAMVTCLWGIQKYAFPYAGFFLDVFDEKKYVFRDDTGGPFYILGSFFYHSLITPFIKNIELIRSYHMRDWHVMSTQLSLPGSATEFGLAAVAIWTILLLIGLWALFTLKTIPKFRLLLGLLILGQMALHLLYGEETFLYSLHFIVLLIPLVALGLLTPLRKILVGLLIILIPCVGWNNYQQLDKALTHLRIYGCARDQMTIQKYFRPNDPWPRGKGHVILAYPGTEALAKAYHEPGASFSPAVGSYGVSFWVVDQNKNIVATSDNIPMSDLAQSFEFSNKDGIPGIKTVSPYYQAVWMSTSLGNWELQLTNTSNHELAVLFRGVGPAAGRVKNLSFEHGELRINKDWAIRIDPQMGQAILGDERNPDWKKSIQAINEFSSEHGWGFAKFYLPANSKISLALSSASLSESPEHSYEFSDSVFHFSLPDKTFEDSLRAQIAHLQMGIVGLQTRPADPISFPQTRQQEGAYITAALAQAGNLQTAKTLALYLAENDFPGTEGPEADMPGLTLWALNEVSSRAADADFNQKIFPHIKRKVAIIETMRTSDHDTYAPIQGNLIHELSNQSYLTLALLSQTGKKGLVKGKVAGELRTLYASGISYRGLLSAAALAQRTNHLDEANSWRESAEKLFNASKKEIEEAFKSDSWIFSTGIWPTQIVVPYIELYKDKLEERWKNTRRSDGGFQYELDSSHFAIAEAHQFLMINRDDLLWQTLNWFWNHQSSPGLYTWGKKIGLTEDYFNWETVRGWDKPKEVTPDYGAAAQMLLLQMDMLAYLEQSQGSPVIIIGAGLKKSWLDQPMSVKQLSLPYRTVDWEWDGKIMRVTIQGEPAAVKLGSVFPAETIIEINLKN